MWSTYSLNVTFVILFVALILIAYFSQKTNDHPVLSTIRLMSCHHVKLTPEPELIVEEEMRVMAPNLPASVNLYTRAGSSKIPVDDQGAYGSCTAHALRYAWNLWKMRLTPNAPLILPSRCFWYAESRRFLGDDVPLEDFGSTNEATIWVLKNKGSIAETGYPYNAQNMTRAPPSPIISGGIVNKSQAALPFLFHVNTNQNIQKLKEVLASGKSIIVAIMVYSSFMTNSVMRTGIVPLPNTRQERLLGGHAICISGYNSTNFTFRNSWGAKVGVNGLFQIPQTYIGNWNLTGDAWIL